MFLPNFLLLTQQELGSWKWVKWKMNTIFARIKEQFGLSLSKLTFKTIGRGAWVARSVERPTLDLGSGHDPRVVGVSPVLGS